MSDERPLPPGSATDGAVALRETGAVPLRPTDPARVGPYAPLALLGGGGMGRVYLARSAHGGPGLFAVKVIRPEYAEDPRFRGRFEREAAVHARLSTPCVPRLCGTGFDGELLWMATEYVPGVALTEAVRGDGALPAAAVRRLLGDLAAALAGFAAAEIVHRDLKPSNILLSVRGTHVIDFGISKALDAEGLTGTGDRVGTPGYMSPEYLRTGRCTPASDVFSLAGTLVYAATGHAPFGDGTGVDVMHRVAFEPPDPDLLSLLAAAVPDLAGLLAAGLSKDPARRPVPRELIDAATPAPSAWPSPVAERVLARQRAYDTLRRLPVRSPAPAPAPVRTPRGRRTLTIAAAVTTTLLASTGALLLTHEQPRTTAASPLPGLAPADPTGSAAGHPGTVEGASPAGATPDENAVVPQGEAGRPETTPPPSPAAPTPSPTSARPAPASPSPAATAPGAPHDAACAYYAGSGRTQRGDTGDRVREVQCLLAERGYGVGPTGVTGVFDEDTEAAVRAFQSATHLPVDGVVTRATWTELR